jgi:hypothetical protein
MKSVEIQLRLPHHDFSPFSKFQLAGCEKIASARFSAACWSDHRGL